MEHGYREWTTEGSSGSKSTYNSSRACRRTEIWKSEKLDKRVPQELKEKQIIWPFEVASSLILGYNSDHLDHSVSWKVFSIQWWLDRDQARQHFKKPELHQKKVMVAVWRFAPGLAKWIQQKSVVIKLICTKNFYLISWLWTIKRTSSSAPCIHIF